MYYFYFRFISNLIISYELFHKDDVQKAIKKMLEIIDWLEKLNHNTSDKFYLSIKAGINHIAIATCVYMLLVINLNEESKWVNHFFFQV